MNLKKLSKFPPSDDRSLNVWYVKIPFFSSFFPLSSITVSLPIFVHWTLEFYEFHVVASTFDSCRGWEENEEEEKNDESQPRIESEKLKGEEVE